MRYRLLGGTGLRVSELCLGAMTFGQQRGSWGAPASESRAIFDRFVGAGGNFIDTANMYQAGESETLLGELLEDRRHEVVLATKYSLGARPNDLNSGGNHRKSLVQALEGSLKRLRTDYVDLYWMHVWDSLTPIEEVLRALDDVVRAGKVLYIGLSDTPAWVVARGQAIAELRGWSGLAATQVPYSLIERTIEREILPMAAGLNLAVLAWGSLGNGLLSGKYSGWQGAPKENTSGRLNDPGYPVHGYTSRAGKIAQAVVEIAQEADATPAQIALAWVRSRSSLIIPIIGARTIHQLEDNIACLDIHLSPEQSKRLDEVSAIELGFPTDFYPAVEQTLFGKMRDLLDPRIRS
jgi:aryl-alcohol dehydrogenase-like predicted oxidoreductase